MQLFNVFAVRGVHAERNTMTFGFLDTEHLDTQFDSSH
jgi:hypothetical protein